MRVVREPKIEVIGKYAKWKCNECGIEKVYQVSMFVTINGELISTCGWECRKCGRGRMIFQGVIKE